MWFNLWPLQSACWDIRQDTESKNCSKRLRVWVDGYCSWWPAGLPSVYECVCKKGDMICWTWIWGRWCLHWEKPSSPVLHDCPLIVGINSSVIISHCFSNIWKSCWSPPRSLKKTSGLITMKWWRCSAALTSSASVTSALRVTIKAITQTQQPQKGLRDRDSSRWVGKTSRESSPEWKMWKFYNRMCRLSISADKAVKDSEPIFTPLTRLMEKRCPYVKQQETAMSRVKKCQEELPLTVKIQPIHTLIQYNFLYSELLSMWQQLCPSIATNYGKFWRNNGEKERRVSF